MNAQPDLTALRTTIETLDGDLLDLLRRRMEVVEQIASTKIRQAVPLRDPLREDRVLQKVRAAAVSRGLAPHDIERLFRVVLEMSVAHQMGFLRSLDTTPLRIAYQGVEGAYSHLAAQERYERRPGGALLTGYPQLSEAAAAVVSGAADLAILPIENSTAGSIDATYDLLGSLPLTILGEVIHPVRHCLLALPGARLEELRAVLSHPQALAQCLAFLATVPWITAQPEYDTAGSARMVAERGDRSLAAIASDRAASAHGLEILRHGIQTETGNATRFIEVALEAAPHPPGQPAKTSLLLVVDHQPGSLATILSTLAARGINLLKVESRPIPTESWNYRFFMDVEGHAGDEPLAAALNAVCPLTRELKVLGSYAPAPNPRPGPAASW